jgi:hypothetical protein
MDVRLTPKLEKIVDKKVTGRQPSATDVLRGGCGWSRNAMSSIERGLRNLAEILRQQ